MREETVNRPLYAVMRSKFPDKRSVLPEELYQWIGHPEYIGDGNMLNTCAIRLSMALIRVGVSIWPGNITVLAGGMRGRRIESSQRKLSRFLVGRWGEPEKYKGGQAARKGIGQRHGVISFFQLLGPTDQQGHIDLIAPDSWQTLICEDDCYWQSVDVWFWPLK